MTTRRQLLADLVVVGVASSALAQQPGRRYRLGWLDATAGRNQSYQTAFGQRLRELGFTEGSNLVIEFRSTAGQPLRMAELAAELAKLNCDAVLVPAPEAGLVAMKDASKNVPIVLIANDYDPVATGHVAQMARPGGRITGVSQLQTELPAKRLQVLKELMPGLRRVGVLGDEATTGQLAVTQAAAARLGVELVVHTFDRAPYDYAAAFAAFARGKAEALVSLGSGNFVPARRLIPELAIQHRLPAIFQNSLWVDEGGLLAYGPNFTATYRRAAEQVAQVLSGANPGEIPLEQSNAVELTINLYTAKALGLSVPQSLRLRADRLIE